MDYNGLYTSLLLMRLSNGEYIPLPSVQASYGPFNSLDEAKADLINTFKDISNVPRGYTFCVIEDDKPQEYWLTKAGDWSSKEKKNTSSQSSTENNILISAIDGYLQVSYDGGDTWTKIVSMEALKGERGDDGKDAVADLSKIQIKMSSKEVSEPDPEDPNESITHTEYTLEYTINGGVNWTNIGTIKSGSGSGGSGHIITIETWTDGNQYWKQDGNWMLDDHGNMVRANGKDGEDGHDGEGYSTQFKSIIFKRSNNTRIVNDVELLQESEYPQGGTYNNPVPPSGNWYDGVPNGTAKLWMSTRWFSTNEAINDANTWSVPAPATDTADMDFEYSNAPLSEIPNGPGINKNINIYNPTTNPNGWYDGDQYPELLVDANWMAMRTAKNGVWGPWKVFKIRGEAGEDAIIPAVQFTSIVFRRSNNTRVVSGKVKLASAEYPQGGSYESPVPTNRDSQNRLLWTDGLPVGNGELLWMSTRKFSSDGNHGEWTEPIQAADGVNGYDFEWNDAENPATPYPTRQSPDDNNPRKTNPNDGWYDEAGQNSDPIWMAMREYEGNAYKPGSSWTVMRVKGERGTDGTSFVPKGQLFGIFDNLNQAKSYYQSHSSTLGTQKYAIVGNNLESLYEFSSTYPNGNQVSGLTIGDAYTNTGGAGKYEQTAGDLKDHVFIWDGDNFVDFGKIKGDPGDDVYFHIKYSNDGGRTFTFSGEVQDGETPGDYIGTLVDNNAADSMNPADYKWAKFRGEDGFGYEYIFKLTNEENAPLVPQPPYPNYIVNEGTQNERTVTYQDDDYVPDGWTDDPGSPTKALPYCWVAYRRKIDGVWQAYRGGSADSRRAALFSIYSSNGRGIDHIEEMYAVWNYGDQDHIPPLNVFTQNIPDFDVTHGFKYLWNYEIIHYDDDTTQNTEPECIAVSEMGKSIASIQEFYYASSFGDSSANDLQTHLPQWGGENRSSSWKTKPMNVDKNTPFLWNFELITFTDGTQTWTDPVIIAYYVYTDIEYLTKIFKKVEGDENTAYLGGLIGAIDENQKVQAMLNATDIGKDAEHGKLYIAAGMNGLDGTDAQKNQKAQNATFKVYEDGHVAMRSAELQGYLTQHFRRVHDVSEYLADTGLGTVARFLDKSKLSNALLLGWNTLSFTEDNETVEFSTSYQVNLSTILTSERAGRVIFSNQLYVSKNGTVFSNNNFGKTQLVGYFILPNGTITSGSSGVLLLGGWIEVIKVSSLDKDMQLIVPQLTTMDNLYIVTGWGGSVRFTDVETMLNVNENQAVVSNASIGFNVTEARSKTTYVPDDVNVFRVTEFTRNVLVIGDNTADTLYIVVPNFDSESFYDQAIDDIQFNVLFNNYHRRIVFKEEVPGANTSAAEVPNLPNLISISLGDIVVPKTEGTPDITLFRAGLRLTYIPSCNYTVIGKWLAEDITPKIFV